MGPRWPKPLPVFDPGDLQAREEIERLAALEDAQFDREAEVVAHAPEFLPIGTAEVERVERDWSRMQMGSPERRTYDEWGVVR